MAGVSNGVREDLILQMWELDWPTGLPAAAGCLFPAARAVLQQRRGCVCVHACVQCDPYLEILETAEVRWGSLPGWIMGGGNLKSSRSFAKQ